MRLERLLRRYDDAAISANGHRHEPLAGTVIGVIVSLIAITILSSFITQRIMSIKKWKRLPFVLWVVFAILIDSWLFVFVTAILQHGIGINISYIMCSAAILLCLICYISTKLIYLFLVEKAFIVRDGTTRRLHSRLYIFNSFGMLTVYVLIAIMNFIFRINRIEEGQCIIGMQKPVMLPLISFDLLVNVYLTCLFLIPLQRLYTFRHLQQTAANIRIRTVAMRTLVGAICTTISSVVNLTTLMVLNGEPGWVCLMCCNIDILFSAIVIQWVTSRDNAATYSTDPYRRHPYARGADNTTTPRGTIPRHDDDDINMVNNSNSNSNSNSNNTAATNNTVQMTTTLSSSSRPLNNTCSTIMKDDLDDLMTMPNCAVRHHHHLKVMVDGRMNPLLLTSEEDCYCVEGCRGGRRCGRGGGGSSGCGPITATTTTTMTEGEYVLPDLTAAVLGSIGSIGTDEEQQRHSNQQQEQFQARSEKENEETTRRQSVHGINQKGKGPDICKNEKSPPGSIHST